MKKWEMLVNFWKIENSRHSVDWWHEKPRFSWQAKWVITDELAELLTRLQKAGVRSWVECKIMGMIAHAYPP